MRQTLSSQQLPEIGFIRQPQVLQIAAFSASTLWRKCKSGQFPKPVRLSENMTAWRVEDVRAWVNAHGEIAKQDATGNSKQISGIGGC